MSYSDVVAPPSEGHVDSQTSSRLQLIEQLESTVISLPFELPDSEAAQQWMMEVDFVDLLEGDLAEVERLAYSAPSSSARSYLLGVVAVRASRPV